jgi:electron transfer flavoprotein beta subunit
MKIIVLAKEVPDTWGVRTLDPVSGWLDRAASERVIDEINERTIEHALAYRDSGADVEIVTLTLAPAGSEDSVRKLLAMGADSAIVVTDARLAGADAVHTARVIAAAIAKAGADLVLAGNESTDGRGGIVPSMVAEYLGWASIPTADSITIGANYVDATCLVDGETLTLNAQYPAVVSVSERSAEPRFPSFKGIMQAKKKDLTVWSLDDIDATSPHAATSVMVSAALRPAREAGTRIEDDGTAATQLVDFLAAEKLI